MSPLQRDLVALACGAVLIALACEDLKIIATEIRQDGSSGGDDTETETVLNVDTDTNTGDHGDTDIDSDTGTGAQSCEGLPGSPGDVTRTVQVGDASRSYVLHIPEAYTGDEPVPLIVDFHAVSSSGARQRASSPYPPVTDAEGVVMAFPDGLAGPAGTAWNIGPCCVDEADDLAFARALVADAAATACIDGSRVFAVGTSMGGGMCNHLACQASDIFAAVAPSAFDLIEETVSDCTRPITVVSFRGTADPLVPYDGGYSNVVPGHPITFLGALGTFDKWAEINGCTGSAVLDVNGCQSFSSSQCAAGVEVMLCTEQGGGIEAGDATIAWPILKRHPRP